MNPIGYLGRLLNEHFFLRRTVFPADSLRKPGKQEKADAGSWVLLQLRTLHPHHSAWVQVQLQDPDGVPGSCLWSDLGLARSGEPSEEQTSGWENLSLALSLCQSTSPLNKYIWNEGKRAPLFLCHPPP